MQRKNRKKRFLRKTGTKRGTGRAMMDGGTCLRSTGKHDPLRRLHHQNGSQLVWESESVGAGGIVKVRGGLRPTGEGWARFRGMPTFE